MKLRLEVTKDYLEVLPSISIYRQRMGTYWRLRLSFAWLIFALTLEIRWK
jgi:hypothetical protein